MIRAVLFDFYGVWTTDIFNKYIALAEQQSPAIALELRQVMAKYYVGLADIDYVTSSFRVILNYPDIEEGIFNLNPEDISPAVVEFMQYLHGHFLKLGILANVGRQEYNLLGEFNARHQLFEVITTSLDIGGSVLTKEAFIKTLQDIGEPPKSCLIITGNDEYHRFAESYGIPVLQFQDFPALKVTLAQLIEENR